MTKRNALSPLACTAIAAVLAIAPATAFAQEVVVPAPAPAADPAPAPAARAAAPAPIVIPEMRAAPVVQAVPEPSVAPEPAAATSPARATATRSAPRQTARAAAPVAAAPLAAQAVPAATAVPLSDAVPAVVSPPVAAIDPAPQPAAAPAQDNSTALELGLVGLVALGGVAAYAAARRRRRVDQPAAAFNDERLAAPAPTMAEPRAVWIPPVAASVAAPPLIARTPLNTSGAGSAIPAGPLPTGPALADLFERMARAGPDADNPFKGDKRRRARVRWLMKQHEYRLRDAAGQNAEDRFDFRTYAASNKLTQPERIRREVVPA